MRHYLSNLKIESDWYPRLKTWLLSRWDIFVWQRLDICRCQHCNTVFLQTLHFNVPVSLSGCVGIKASSVSLGPSILDFIPVLV
jgi:hypothetical protein